MTRLRMTALAFLGCVMFAASGGFAMAADTLESGGVAPEFSDLPGIDGRRWSSSDFADASVLIICFTCNRCPYAVDYEERLGALHEKYSADPKSVQLIVVNSNSGPGESLSDMQQRATDRQLGFPYLKDEDQQFARAMGAVYTPEFFVLNRRRQLVYKGALDDSTNADEVQQRFVEQAVSSVLKGEPVAMSFVGARGCTIRFRRRPPQPVGD